VDEYDKQRKFQRLIVGLVCLVSALLPIGNLAALPITIRGSTTLHAHVIVDGQAHVIRGTLTDDIGAPVKGVDVFLQLQSPQGTMLALPKGSSCVPQAPAPRLNQGTYTIKTNTEGRFCLRVPLFADQAKLKIEFTGNKTLKGSEQSLPFQAGAGKIFLKWDPRPETIDLDLPRVLVHVTVGTADDSQLSFENVSLGLFTENNQKLATSITDERGHAFFEIQTKQLSGPSPGTLEVRASSSKQLIVPLKASVIKMAHVTLIASQPTKALVPHDGFSIVVVAESSRGPVQSGAIEARVGETSVGVGSVKQGKAVVPMHFDVPESTVLPIQFTYLPDSQRYRPEKALVLNVPVSPPSPWRRAPLFLVGIGLLGWLARSWRRAPASKTARDSVVDGSKVRVPKAEIIEEGPRLATGYEGRVVDAHDGYAIQQALVRVLLGDFLGQRVVIETVTDGQGRFSLHGAYDASHRMVIESEFHSLLERPMPMPGRMTVTLMTRRRALLERLVIAVKKAGGVWGESKEPTPNQVAKVAQANYQEKPAAWAKAVDESTYGPHEVDREKEAQVIALETELSNLPRKARM
jgi:hypothetical protein